MSCHYLRANVCNPHDLALFEVHVLVDAGMDQVPQIVIKSLEYDLCSELFTILCLF